MCTKIIQRLVLGYFLLTGLVFAQNVTITPLPSSGISQSPSQAAGNQVQMTDINDIKPLEHPVVDWTVAYYLLGAALVCIIVWALIHFWRKRRRRRDIPVEVRVPPHESALKLLDELAAAEYWDAKEFYFRLSAIVRTYIQGRYGINALEMTTEELLPRIDVLDVDRTIQQELKTLLRSADPVKFAGLSAPPDLMRDNLAFVRKFVEHTQPATGLDTAQS